MIDIDILNFQCRDIILRFIHEYNCDQYMNYYIDKYCFKNSSKNSFMLENKQKDSQLDR